MILEYTQKTDLDSISLFTLPFLPSSQLCVKFMNDDGFDPDLSRLSPTQFSFSDNEAH